MKNLFLLPAFLLLISCSKKPTADFTFDPVQPKIGQAIDFINTSTNAKNYSWNFGNSNTSKEKSPGFVYNVVGSYIVTLTSYNGMKSSSKSATITVVP